MMIIGIDYHPSFQTIAFLIEEPGECGEQELNHSDGQAEKFYRDLKQRGTTGTIGLPNPNQRSVVKTSGFCHPYIYMPVYLAGSSGRDSRRSRVKG